MSNELHVFSPRLTKSTRNYYIFTAVFSVFFFYRANEAGNLGFALVGVFVLSAPVAFRGWIVLTSKVVVTTSYEVILKQGRQVVNLGALAELTMHSPRFPLPFGFGVPTLVGNGQAVRAEPLVSTFWVTPEAREEFIALLKSAGGV